MADSQHERYWRQVKNEEYIRSFSKDFKGGHWYSGSDHRRAHAPRGESPGSTIAAIILAFFGICVTLMMLGYIAVRMGV